MQHLESSGPMEPLRIAGGLMHHITSTCPARQRSQQRMMCPEPREESREESPSRFPSSNTFTAQLSNGGSRFLLLAYAVYVSSLEPHSSAWTTTQQHLAEPEFESFPNSHLTFWAMEAPSLTIPPEQPWNENGNMAFDTELVSRSMSPSEASTSERLGGGHYTKLPPKLIPGVRKVNLEGFKNRFSQKEDIYALDVLIATDNLKDEIVRERQKRKKYENEPGSLFGPRIHESTPIASTQPGGGGWIQAVRIQSQAVLHHLFNVAGESWRTYTPTEFSRPFSILISCQNGMKNILTHLESKWAAHEAGEASDDKTWDTQPTDQGHSNPDGQEPANPDVDSIEALRAVRCYVKFVDEEILPLVRWFDDTDRNQARFNDIFFLFKYGDLVCASDAMVVSKPGSTREGTSGMYQCLWRVYDIRRTDKEAIMRPSQERPYYGPQYDLSGLKEEPEPNTEDVLEVWAYYVDYDGTSYVAVKHPFRVYSYSGKCNITRLPCYPIRYMEGWKTYLEEQKMQGQRFECCLRNRHWLYNGWTLTSSPGGLEIFADTDNEYGLPQYGLPQPNLPRPGRRKHSEYIDSHVMIDFAETFHEDPRLKPHFDAIITERSNKGDNISRIPLYTWPNSMGSLLFQPTEVFFDQTTFLWDSIGGAYKDGFLEACQLQFVSQDDQSSITLEDEDYALLPRRMFAYALRDRKFAMVDVRYLSEFPRQHDVFGSLKIDKEYKQMVKGLVASHLAKKQLEEKYSNAAKVNQSQDIIYGKGRGLVILLHGVPGVGKTATAEAVALEYGKPLFVITCGDLGLTPREVEASLNEIFRLAHLWQCVLLFDEADVFLAQRSRYDLARNALVSVFLRILEYYNGILFLTTNRVGTLDEAFKSRIHMSLYYPPLNSKQVELIFDMNLKKVAEMEKERHKVTGEPELDIRESAIANFANEHSAKTQVRGGRWNGRQIRNAFQIATSLARFHALEEEELEEAKGKEAQRRRPVLDDTQFRKVERATEAFKDYLERTKGYNDADLAHILGDRDDLYRQGKLFEGLAGSSAAGYHGTGAHAHGPQYQGGSYGQGMHPDYAGQASGSSAPNVDFPMMNPGPMTYGYNEPSCQPAVSHGGIGVGGYPTAPQHHPGLNPGNSRAPMANPGQSGEPYRAGMSEGPQQGYGHSMDPKHGYIRGGHPYMYESGGHPPPPQLRRSPAPDETRYD
ncbi:hypothetical protein FDECE_7767 [Fusarium decemcellulare]|nr:hypothetical protein FDECE_7767 [Fusarium decemcellulare]